MLRKRIIRLASAIVMATMLFVAGLTITACKDNPSQNNQVLLISIDGMRPDAIQNTEYGKYLETECSYSLSARTVYPSVTLPCHMSMFYSVEPTEHGVTSNSYTPLDSLSYGISESLSERGKKTAAFYNWQPISNVVSNHENVYSEFIVPDTIGWEAANRDTADACIDYLKENTVDFAFLYLGFLDEWGHRYGWLSDEYYYALNESLSLVDKVIEGLSSDYTVIITTDHGGHDTTHGTDSTEDMTIPIFVKGRDFEKGKVYGTASILDIAPTVLDVLGVDRPTVWKGISLKDR